MDNLWIYALGLVAQGLFSARMLVQWIRSEKAHTVVNPTLFWVLSLLYLISLGITINLRRQATRELASANEN